MTNETSSMSNSIRGLLRLLPVLGLIVGGLSIGTVAATAQIAPASSAQPSFREPEMKPHGEGMYYPNERRHRLRRHHRRLRRAGHARADRR